jgi:putative FmdB family regulatory protein
MPQYDQQCTECNAEWEDMRFIMEIDNNPNCLKCGGESKRIIKLGSGSSSMFPTEWDHIRDKKGQPMHFRSKKELNAECKRQGKFSEYYG